jgi:hypothetical protein
VHARYILHTISDYERLNTYGDWGNESPEVISEENLGQNTLGLSEWITWDRFLLFVVYLLRYAGFGCNYNLLGTSRQLCEPR